MAAAKAKSTTKAYASDWSRFCAFCDDRNFEALPAHPDVVALFAHVEADLGTSPVTIGRRVAAINHHHNDNGVATPSARDVAGVIAGMLAGVRRRYARPKRQKNPADAQILKQMLDTITGTRAHASRDRAILALGMAGAFRRSELVDLQLRDLSFEAVMGADTLPMVGRLLGHAAIGSTMRYAHHDDAHLLTAAEKNRGIGHLDDRRSAYQSESGPAKGDFGVIKYHEKRAVATWHK